MKAPQDKKTFTKGILGEKDALVFQADVDFSSPYKRSNITSSNFPITNFAAKKAEDFAANKAKGRNLPRKSVEISPQEQAGAALTSQAAIPSGMVETDEIDSSGYTSEDFYADIDNLIAEVHGAEAMNVLHDANVNEYGKFYYQKAYDVVDNNPILYQYFEEYHPEMLQELKDLSTKYGVVV